MPLLCSWKRFVPAALLLAAAAVLLEARDRNEILPSHEELSSFPQFLGPWQGIGLTLTPGELAVLGPGRFLLRDYVNPGDQSLLNLFVAFFPSQRSGDTIHSPKNCIPGSGWVPVSSSHIAIQRAGFKTIFVNRYIIAKGRDRDIVFYWYQAHGRVTANEYWAKIFLVADAIQLNRTDGALVRIVVPISSTGEDAAQSRGLEFIHQILPILDRYIPR
jgi:EpsI family protein